MKVEFYINLGNSNGISFFNQLINFRKQSFYQLCICQNDQWYLSWLFLLVLFDIFATFFTTVPIGNCLFKFSYTNIHDNVSCVFTIDYEQVFAPSNSVKVIDLLNPISANFTKWSNTQTIRRVLPTNCLSVFDRFVGLGL